MSDDPIPRLRLELWAAHDELADFISRQLGFGPLETLPAGLRDRVDREVDDALSAWRSVEARVQVRFDLQRLLVAYRTIERKLEGGLGPDGQDP